MSNSGEVVITTADLLVYREIHPSWVVNSRLSSQAFKPTKKDEGRLSVRNSDKITAEDCHKFQTEKLNLKSMGNYGVTIGEISEASLQCFESPITSEPVDPSHCHISFVSLTGSQIQTKADKLVSAARSRGQIHPKVQA